MTFKFIFNKYASDTNKWEMQDMRGNFIQAYPDCANFNKVMKGIKKDKINLVEITAVVKKCL
jgi:hypothetical protein